VAHPRTAQPNPQVISTDRHLLQGWVELSDVKWDASRRRLTGKANVIGGEPLKIVLANGGLKPATATGAGAKLEPHPAGGDLAVLVLDHPTSGQVSWGVEY
jgi:hypothetical protein